MPRPRFSLRTLLNVVTVAAIVAWYFRPSQIEIIGDIGQADVAAICERAKISQKLGDEPILQIWLVEAGKVQVTTGEFPERIRILMLEKKGNAWTVTASVPWRRSNRFSQLPSHDAS